MPPRVLSEEDVIVIITTEVYLVGIFGIELILHAGAAAFCMCVTFFHLRLCHGLAWMNAKCPPKPLCLSPYSTEQGRKNTVKGLWVEIRTGSDHSPIAVTSKTD